ncbi:MAG TPA: DUF2934 domain-containing protein [bacterium]|nr:DUF2934 domain-containing protein [bacterium]
MGRTLARRRNSQEGESAKKSPQRPRPSEDEIRARAYQIYIERGATPGHDLDDWLRAERELKGSR